MRPRGNEVALPNGALPEVFSPYLDNLIMKTGGPTGPIGLQFVQQDIERVDFGKLSHDPLSEDEYSVENAPGLVYKYDGRALWTIVFKCAAYCRFCTRVEKVGIKENVPLNPSQVDQTLKFIRQTPDINEIILSGGDPLTAPPAMLNYVLEKLGQMQKDKILKFVRIGTRLPIHNPEAIKQRHYDAVAKVDDPRLMVHINHPAELTPQAVAAIRKFRAKKDEFGEAVGGAIVLSQSVLLRGVNDSVETLVTLFTKIAEAGIQPYYLFQNDDVPQAQHLTVPPAEALALWEKLTPRLSGIVNTADLVFDSSSGPYGEPGYGKVRVPKGGWDYDRTKFTDHHGRVHILT